MLIDFGPLRRHRDLRLLWLGRGVSFFGSMITYVAVPFQVYKLTGSTLAVGMLGVAELVALLGLAFLGGALADAKDRRSLVLTTELGLLACAVALAGNAALDRPNVASIFVLAAVMSGLGALQRPALEAMIPRLVPPDELSATSALTTMEMTVAMIAGPAVGGVLLASVGAGATYLVDAATFVVSIAALAAMHAVPPPDDAERPSLRRVVEGLQYARRRQDLLGTYVVDFWAMFFGMPTALFPAIAKGYGGPKALGLLYSAEAVGALLATATSGWTKRIHRHGMAITIAAVVWGLAIVLFGFARWLPLALVGLGIAGGADMISGIFRMTMWNQTIPDSLRGRLASIEMVSYSSGPLLGNAESGLAAAAIGVRGAVVSGGVLCVVGVVATAVALPAFRAYDARHTRAPVVTLPDA